MDPSPPEPPQQPPIPLPEVLPEAGPAAAPVTGANAVPQGARRSRAQARLRARAGGDPIVAWTPAWVSREQRLHRLVAARTLDIVVLTENELVLVTKGFFTRRPRRRVFGAALERLTTVDVPVPRGRRLVVSGREAPIRIELCATPRATTFAEALLTRTGPTGDVRAEPAPVDGATRSQ